MAVIRCPVQEKVEEECPVCTRGVVGESEEEQIEYFTVMGCGHWLVQTA